MKKESRGFIAPLVSPHLFSCFLIIRSPVSFCSGSAGRAIPYLIDVIYGYWEYSRLLGECLCLDDSFYELVLVGCCVSCLVWKTGPLLTGTTPVVCSFIFRLRDSSSRIELLHAYDMVKGPAHSLGTPTSGDEYCVP